MSELTPSCEYVPALSCPPREEIEAVPLPGPPREEVKLKTANDFPSLLVIVTQYSYSDTILASIGSIQQ